MTTIKTYECDFCDGDVPDISDSGTGLNFADRVTCEELVTAPKDEADYHLCNRCLVALRKLLKEDSSPELKPVIVCCACGKHPMKSQEYVTIARATPVFMCNDCYFKMLEDPNNIQSNLKLKEPKS
jgi:hypothetical protein